MPTKFVRLPESVWGLSQDLSAARKRRLLSSPPYEELVLRLANEAKPVFLKREQSRDAHGYFRAVIALAVPPATLDAFYSSASGYRAQYYYSPEFGIKANQVVLDSLLCKALLFAERQKKRTCRADWVEKSLRDQDAKIWPRQGLWLRYGRYGRNVDRNLHVARWMSHLDDSDTKRQTRAKRSMLTPCDENVLELKGGFLTVSGTPLGTFKPKRALNIHELGFT
jgi:hypothetical protein